MPIPLWSKLGALVFFALAVWMFVISRNPRDWRRLFQESMHKGKPVSVNMNKRLDEIMKKWAVNLLALFIVLGVASLITGFVVRQGRQLARGTDRIEDSQNRENVERLQQMLEKERMEDLVREASKRPQER